jgi:hypothetical protein
VRGESWVKSPLTHTDTDIAEELRVKRSEKASKSQPNPISPFIQREGTTVCLPTFPDLDLGFPEAYISPDYLPTWLLAPNLPEGRNEQSVL